jgi:hypothetical protein
VKTNADFESRVKGHSHWMAESRRFGSKTYLGGGVMDLKILWFDQNFFDFDIEKTGVLFYIVLLKKPVLVC